MLFVIYWLNEDCLSQFKQRGFSTLPARICNLHDNSRAPVGSPLGSALGLPRRFHCCCFPITKPSTPKDEKKIWFPCHVHNDMYVWFHAVTAEGDGAVVIKFLQTHRRWYIKDCRVERRPSYAAANPKKICFIAITKDRQSGVAFHVSHNNGVSVIIIPQSDLVPFPLSCIQISCGFLTGYELPCRENHSITQLCCCMSYMSYRRSFLTWRWIVQAVLCYLCDGVGEPWCKFWVIIT